ncbi:hypothetical protein PV08_11595 [Exophiala spinifera]|uniref:Fucose-specific lectin n=1 Tax=Exophiala spinifera TaxID=91928 RepID=A0A0D1Y6X5_9EURO|nr:uncharacterized protein PV08_11595 [Exophiala spinifera]KIW10631.1 hypothetical protein PV08_11595 [Exophiala spinifera]
MARTGSSGCYMNTIRYQAITLPETEPRTPYAVYIINKETIYCVNGNEDSPPAKVLGKAGNWPGFGAIVESAQSLYVAEQALFKVSTWDGSYKRLGSGTWEESTSMAWFGDLYIIQRGSLYSADQTTGQYKLLGRPDDWQGHTSMAAVMLDRDGVSSRRLFVIQSEKLWEVARDGTYKRVGMANWYTPAYISAIGEALYAIENSRFQYIDGNTGQYTVIGEAVYSQTTAFAGADGQAFAIDAGRLLRINIYDGSHVKLSDGWDGPSVMTVVRNAKCRSE